MIYPENYSYFKPSKLKSFFREILRVWVTQPYIPSEDVAGFEYHPKKNRFLMAVARLLLPLLARRGLICLASPFMTERSYGMEFRAGMKFLEIGCGAGWEAHLTDPSLSIRSMARRGILAVGVEPSAACRAELVKDGVRVYPTVKALELNETGFFDFIRMNWALEHVADPVDMLRTLTGFCGPQTKMLITVPNYDGISYKIAPDCIEVPVHLQYFTEKSLRKLCVMTGFKVDRLFTFCTPSLLAVMIGFKENKEPNQVLYRERKRLLGLMDDAYRTKKGDELFCLLSRSFE
ncbi:MAG: class I SAM-dependent methyltransferase [Elusimicrobia bacterium]|nr:class I SAM-dependent methyltransferase [Elusimicrobiota bacterium]